jgi:histidinol-phosphate phosphatase family protein
VRIAFHLPSIAPGSRLEHAVAGLAERGHRLFRAGRAPAGSALATVGEPAGDRLARPECDVVVGGGRARGPLALAALSQARAVVVALEAGTHRRWSAIERWGWATAEASGIVGEEEVAEFLARVPEHERERWSIWPVERADLPPAVHPDTTVLERTCERALARRSAGPGRAALFVDRDGTLIAERQHLADPAGVELLPGVAAALRTCRANGHPVVVISNQAGVGRALFPETRVHAVMARLRALLRSEGVELDAVRHCPHAPDAGCDCRKPGARLLFEAAEDLRLSLPDSVMVGDKWIDVDAGHAAGAAGVLVRTGYGEEEARRARAPGARPADAVGADLAAAVQWFLARHA